jgi:acyl CoA:acetate/3-ketoacid CoA transferase alpha subunit
MRWCTLSSRINLGNLGYALTARNFNPVIAMAADTVIACVDTSSRSVSLRPTTS